tara:strand:+ start:254 stop:1477 length:1224 start_codon:yes stop_codon:yes gene_type:complete
MTRAKRQFWLDSKLWAISVAETLAWAGMFYMFPALLLRWQRYFEWNISQLSLGLMFALVISAITGLLSGKLIDKGLGRPLVSLSVVFGGLSILCLLFVQSLWQFYFVWGVVGIFMGGCFYDPCFALLIRKYGGNAKGPLVMVTFFAGLSVTLSFPLSSILATQFGWKVSVLVFSSLLVFLSGPLFWYGFSDQIYIVGRNRVKAKIRSFVIVRNLLRKPIFWGLAVMFTAFGANHIMLLSQILPILTSKGFSENAAVLVATFMGPMQVSGRMLLVGMEKAGNKTMPSLSVSFLCLTILLGASLSLYLVETHRLLIIIFIIFQGVSFGVINIIKPVITAELLGHDNFGFISSIVGFGYIWGFALAPGIAGMILDSLGADAVIRTSFIVAMTGLVTMTTSVVAFKRVSEV